MSLSPGWVRIATDAAVLRRATITSLFVGTILTLANHIDEALSGGIPTSQWPAIAVTYLVPFALSCLTSTVTIRRQRRVGAEGTELLEREIQAINLFPGQNPNPVLRVTEAGRLTYANDASAPVRAALGAEVGSDLPAGRMTAFRAAAASSPAGWIEVTHERQTFAILPVHVPELGVYNLYGTDVTAAKVVERFPDRNPNPVLRMTPDGRLWYANDASDRIIRALGVSKGDALPEDLFGRLQASLADPEASLAEVGGEGRTYRLKPVPIPEFDFVNLYGTDVTAEKAVDRFPNQNPNPVLRLSRGGRMTYANPASELVREALGAEVGDQLDAEVFARVVDAAGHESDPTMDVEAEGRTYRLRVVSLYEFDSINVYGTDITAAREVEKLNAENEQLLLNILPASIAERLRAGETPIADRFDDMTVLFADVVGFTELSSRLEPDAVVTLLNDVFTLCDRLADRFGLEKIKTVGDAYMVVGGLGEADGVHADHAAHRTHAADVASMGLAMLAEVSEFAARSGIALEMRVGMQVGPAVAGVIGLKKFIYDVWGDTVNTASRMESTGLPGRVQVTRETYERLREAFEFEPRGLVDVKGKGRIETWLLVGERAITAEPEIGTT
jgi:class 3 adenylate cyclase